jgi:hypothetical protein
MRRSRKRRSQSKLVIPKRASAMVTSLHGRLSANKKNMTDMKARKNNIIIVREEVWLAQHRKQAVATTISNQLRLHAATWRRVLKTNGISKHRHWRAVCLDLALICDLACPVKYLLGRMDCT